VAETRLLLRHRRGRTTGKVRNIWKGLIVGGLTGAGVGATYDLLGGGVRLVGTAGKKAADVAPETADRVVAAALLATRKAADVAPDAAERVRSAVSGGIARVHEADIADHLRDQAKELVHRIGASHEADEGRAAVEQATERARPVLHATHDRGRLRRIS
jgi:hypothetical protein